jgi:paraquat-inducible protein A
VIGQALADGTGGGTRPELRECPGCGQFQIVPSLEPGMSVRCVRCGTRLRRARANSLSSALSLNLAALVLIAILWTAMLMRVSTAGIVHDTTLTSGPIELVRQGLWPLAIAVAFTTAVAPIVKHLGLVYVLASLKLGLGLPKLPQVFLWARRIGIWAMLEVLLLGVFVAFTKLGGLVHMEVGPAVYALVILTMVTVWADVALDTHEVWEEIEGQGAAVHPADIAHLNDFHPSAIGCEGCDLVSVVHGHDDHCPRCGSPLHPRKPAILQNTWAFVIAAAILYIPANYFPVLTVISAGAGQPSTIIGGVEELLSSQMYPLALLVFFASIMVPLFKLIGLAIMLLGAMLLAAESGASFLLVPRTRLYYVIAWIGRWSMIDIFMESLLGALVQFGAVATIRPGIGAVAFCAVVLLTIFAAEYFDPRLMWDTAGLNPHRPPPPPMRPRLRRAGASRPDTVLRGAGST